jgi:hypothetical protein
MPPAGEASFPVAEPFASFRDCYEWAPDSRQLQACSPPRACGGLFSAKTTQTFNSGRHHGLEQKNHRRDLGCCFSARRMRRRQ